MTSSINDIYGSSSLSNLSNINLGGGITGAALQQWTMLGANSIAYKRLIELEETGTTKQTFSSKTTLLSDRLYNDYYDNDKGEVTKATYTKPTTPADSIKIDEETSAGDLLSDMRTLALAGISGNNLTQTHYDIFESMRQQIASAFVTNSKKETVEVESEAAKGATMAATDDYRYLMDNNTFTIAGADGEREFSFAQGTALTDIADAINEASSSTGVKATAVTNEDGTVSLSLDTTATGKDAFIRVDQAAGSLFAETGASASAKGADAVKTDAEVEDSGEMTRAAMTGGTFKGKLYEDTAFTLQGANGQANFSFKAGTTTQDIVSAINEQSSKTGVIAEVIYNDNGEAEGIGLLSEKSGTGNYITATMTEGSLFAADKKTVSVAGSSKGSDSGEDSGPAIGSLKDLGQVSIDGKTYSFADLVQGGSASLSKNPDAALAVLDQAIKEIYAGLAELDGFDPSSTYIPGANDTSKASQASTNTSEYQNYGSAAMTSWLNKYKSSDS